MRSPKSRSAMEPTLTKWLKPMFFMGGPAQDGAAQAPLWEMKARLPDGGA